MTLSLRTLLFQAVTHGGISFVEFTLGIYLLLVLIGPTPPASVVQATQYVGQFDRDSADSDVLHWGDGKCL